MKPFNAYFNAKFPMNTTDLFHRGIDLYSILYLQDCPEVHANAAETLCAISRYAPSGLASKISSPRSICLYMFWFLVSHVTLFSYLGWNQLLTQFHRKTVPTRSGGLAAEICFG